MYPSGQRRVPPELVNIDLAAFGVPPALIDKRLPFSWTKPAAGQSGVAVPKGCVSVEDASVDVWRVGISLDRTALVRLAGQVAVEANDHFRSGDCLVTAVDRPRPVQHCRGRVRMDARPLCQSSLHPGWTSAIRRIARARPRVPAVSWPTGRMGRTAGRTARPRSPCRQRLSLPGCAGPSSSSRYPHGRLFRPSSQRRRSPPCG